MSPLVSLAIRNLGRHRRRTLVTGGALVFGVSAALFFSGFAKGLVTVMMGNVIDGGVGAIHVYKRGYLTTEDKQLDFDLPVDPAFEQRIRAIPGVRAVSPRLVFEGMLGNGSEAAISQVTGIDTVREVEAVPGRWRGLLGDPLVAGGDGDGVVGKALAEGLKAEPGTALTVLATAKGGQQNVLPFRLKSMLGNRNPLESKRIAIVPLALAQDLLGMPGRATVYVVGIDNLLMGDDVAAKIQAALGDAYDVAPWSRLIPQAQGVFGIIAGVLAFVTGVLFLLVLTGVANTMLMSVHERVREIGTMLAVGVRRGSIVGLFLLEAGTLGIVGGLLGLGLGTTLVTIAHEKGINFKPPGSDVTMILRPDAPPAAFIGLFALATLGSLVAAAYPAWKASKLRPVEALRAV